MGWKKFQPFFLSQCFTKDYTRKVIPQKKGTEVPSKYNSDKPYPFPDLTAGTFGLAGLVGVGVCIGFEGAGTVTDGRTGFT